MYQYNFAEVSFVRNYAQESGGAVYASDSQLSSALNKGSHLWKMKVTMVEL